MMKKFSLDIAMFVPGMQVNHDTLEKQSLGGSETMGLLMAKELSKIGHTVTLFCNTTDPGKKEDKVTYIPSASFASYAITNPHDVLIAQRLPKVFATRMPNKLNLLWCHDLAQGRTKDEFTAVSWNVDKVMTVSKFMTEQYKEVYGCPDELFWTTRNGIDLSSLPVTPRLRNKKQMVYAARPERGLDILIEKMMPLLWEQDPEITLVVAGYDNTAPEMKPYYDYIFGLIEESKGRVKWKGHLTKGELYKLYAESGTYLYPTPSQRAESFREVSCISFMEAQAMGLPVISSENGALPETLHPEAGVLIKGDPWSQGYQRQFVEATLSAMKDEIKWKRMSEAGKKHAQGLGVKELAEEWSEGFCRLIKERNEDPLRLALHFLKRSDVIAAKKALELPVSEDKKEWKTKIEAQIEKEWGFVQDSTSFERHYDEMGKVTDERLSLQEFKEEHFDYTEEKRFKLIEECLRSNEGLQKILNFGCGHGWHDLYMERKVGRKWVGVDVDPGAIKWSETFRDKFARHPENMSFVTGNFTTDIPNHKAGDFDCLIMSEVLEHCVDPKAVVESMEKWVRKDGTVIITVPYGPREFPDYERLKYRNHIHELDFHSLREMFGKKPGLEIMGMYEKHIDELEEPAGFYFIRYRADHKPIGEIDWERKLFLQRPKQTVSALMICGPNSEETLHWCIKSWRVFVDEIIITDCGMSEEAIEIALRYPNIKVLPGPDPKQVGFDEARNTNLNECKGDWVFWIDSDEKVISDHKLHKYFRENIFHGYSIRQHHFAVDTTFKPDMPVRLFRNRPVRDKKIQWFGSVHEHPETGINEGPGLSIIISDVHIAHIGYLVESGRRQRFWRNNPLLEMSNKKYPERILNKYFLMRDNQLLCTYEFQQNGLVVSENIKKRCEETIDLWRKYFRGKGSYMGSDALEYYSQACRILGVGVEVSLCLDSSIDGNHQPKIDMIRFANQEDLGEELKWRVKESMAVVNSKWY